MSQYLLPIGDAGAAIGFGNALGEYNDPRPELARGAVTVFTGENGTGASYTVPDTTGDYLKSVGINAGTHHSIYVPPGLKLIVYDGPDRKRALTTGDYYNRFQTVGPALVNRGTFRVSYGAIYWRWIRVIDARTEAERLRDQQQETLAREVHITAQESDLAQQYRDDAAQTAAALEEARKSVDEREALRRELAEQQIAEAAATARAEQLARQKAEADAQALWVQQQQDAASQIRAARGDALPGWLIPAAAVAGGFLIIGAIMMSRRR